MSYENSTACKLFATHCVVCGKALVDARSVELGIGPDCRNHIDGDIDEGERVIVNQHIFNAAIAAEKGQIEKVIEYADLIAKLGLTVVAEKIRNRFAIEKHRRDPDITIKMKENEYHIKTPFRRGRKEEYIVAWRKIPGRRYRGSGWNSIPESEKTELWSLLKDFFPGKWGVGPSGVFRVPLEENPTELISE